MTTVIQNKMVVSKNRYEIPIVARGKLITDYTN